MSATAFETFQEKAKEMNRVTRLVIDGKLPWSEHEKALAEYEAARAALLATVPEDVLEECEG